MKDVLEMDVLYFPKRKIFYSSKFKALADDNFKVPIVAN